MNPQRRQFIKQGTLAAGALLLARPLQSLGASMFDATVPSTSPGRLTVFHTNDLHNQIEPLNEGRHIGCGGLGNIAGLIRQQQANPLVLDAGDFLDDRLTEADHLLMINAMNLAGFHVATVGNRELAKGQEYLAGLIPSMRFKLVNCNYGFSNPQLQSGIAPYHLVKAGKLKVGITGIGTSLRQVGSTGNIAFYHPYKKANTLANYLKRTLNCKFVICLSHLGFQTNDSGWNNHDFARASRDIDLIISGHGNNTEVTPKVLKNVRGEEVLLSHCGHHGLVSRELGFEFNQNQGKSGLTCKNHVLNHDQLAIPETAA